MRKRPALVDPLHKVRQGGKGSVWDGRMDRRTDGWKDRQTLPDGQKDRWNGWTGTSGHFRSISSPLPAPSGPLGMNEQMEKSDF